MKNKSSTPSNTWLTPRSFYQELDKRFTFDLFDPTPSDNDITKFNGLLVPWLSRVYCNPPYSQVLKEKFIYPKAG